ncbi:MAG: ParA family protein [Candidatus Thiodiazotropha lotti]|nr:ParA family protein [Candidatus Thiodiazotropha lotti]
MRVIAMAGQKGGAGKSTLAIHLAVQAQQQGVETLLADMDLYSRTCSAWGGEREQKTPIVVQVASDDLEAFLLQAKEEGFDLVILDLPRQDDQLVDNVAQRADLTLIPCRPTFADLRTLSSNLEQVSQPYAVVLNACPLDSAIKTKQAWYALEEIGVPVSPISISHHEAFDDALYGGESVTEHDPESKAGDEIRELWMWIEREGLE